MLHLSAVIPQQPQPGSIRGVVRDKEFDAPIAAVQVANNETGEKVATTDQGNFVFSRVPPGKYTLVFSRDGYIRQVKADVVVSAGQLTDLDVALVGEVTEMDEFVAQDTVQINPGSEASLLKLRFQSAALLDSIGADLISRAGASDAAAALRLVAGASVQDNKSAVIRGLPDRYVSSQLNGVRMPTADADKRAVQLDQFPAPVIESIQVSKTFTPDQQGDASGGAVNVRLKSIPDEGVVQFKVQGSYNNEVAGRSDFLTYPGGGINTWGFDDGGRDIQFQNIGHNWTGAAGTSRGDAPQDYKWSFLAGGKREIADGVRVGGLASFFYEQYSSFHDDGQDNKYWVEHPGGPMVPQHKQDIGDNNFKTALYDVTQATQGVRWGALGTLGIESDNHRVGLTYLFTHSAEDQATLSTDTRGKEYFFPGYDVHDSTGAGNRPGDRFTAPYVRLDTLQYTERTTESIQLNGQHKLPFGEFELGDLFKFKPVELDWTAAWSSADQNQPDKRVFSAIWVPRSFNPGFPPYIPPFTTPPTWIAYKPAENSNLGNFQRIWTDISEQSQEYSLDLKLPFEQWSGAEGYAKTGVYTDHVERAFNQNTYSNFNEPLSGLTFQGAWDDPWSSHFPSEDHPLTASPYDIDYKGQQTISAAYGMIDLPIVHSLDVIGGARFESTHIGIQNFPGEFAFWYPPGGNGDQITLHPGDADVDLKENNVLPSIGAVYKPLDPLTLRASYGETVARPTFKELTPIQQQEYAGADVFVGNPGLELAQLKNYDLRADYAMNEGGLLSASWFYKDIRDPIEYVQSPIGSGGNTVTTPKNYPKGELSGYELEARESLGSLWSALDGFAIGANATLIHSQVTIPDGDLQLLANFGYHLPPTRDMTNAPDHLYNLYVTYDLASTGTQLGLFYTVQGDALIAGATQANGNFVPNVYAKQYDTLNFSLSQRIWKYFTLQFQAKNLTNPEISTVYRSPDIGADVLKTTYTKGIELSLALTTSFGF
jgi:TonB-dependent receptor